MYVCICAAVTESQVRQAAHEGVRTFEQLQAELGVAAGCGCCREFAQQVWQRTSDQAPLAARDVSRLAVAA
jgi:bacterioferritin-associated ferredoxin